MARAKELKKGQFYKLPNILQWSYATDVVCTGIYIHVLNRDSTKTILEQNQEIRIFKTLNE